jgi:hypothetical protein
MVHNGRRSLKLNPDCISDRCLSSGLQLVVTSARDNLQANTQTATDVAGNWYLRFRIQYANFRAISNIGLTGLSYCEFTKTHKLSHVFFLTVDIKLSQPYCNEMMQLTRAIGISAICCRSATV